MIEKPEYGKYYVFIGDGMFTGKVTQYQEVSCIPVDKKSSARGYFNFVGGGDNWSDVASISGLYELFREATEAEVLAAKLGVTNEA